MVRIIEDFNERDELRRVEDAVLVFSLACYSALASKGRHFLDMAQVMQTWMDQFQISDVLPPATGVWMHLFIDELEAGNPVLLDPEEMAVWMPPLVHAVWADAFQPGDYARFGAIIGQLYHSGALAPVIEELPELSRTYLAEFLRKFGHIPQEDEE
jgi:hypothetical protein